MDTAAPPPDTQECTPGEGMMIMTMVVMMTMIRVTERMDWILANTQGTENTACASSGSSAGD